MWVNNGMVALILQFFFTARIMIVVGSVCAPWHCDFINHDNKTL